MVASDGVQENAAVKIIKLSSGHDFEVWRWELNQIIKLAIISDFFVRHYVKRWEIYLSEDGFGQLLVSTGAYNLWYTRLHTHTK